MSLKLIPILFIAAVLAGCKVDLPAVDSGTVEVNAGGRITKRELSNSQVQVLSDWVRTHQTGWTFKVEDSFPGTLIHLKRGGATVAVVDVSGGNRIKIKNYVRTLTPEDRAILSPVLTSFLEWEKGMAP